MLEDFYPWFSADESTLCARWMTAKVFICFLLELWLGFLSNVLVEKIIFAIPFQSSNEY